VEVKNEMKKALNLQQYIIKNRRVESTQLADLRLRDTDLYHDVQ
jgi:hypothetical protein